VCERTAVPAPLSLFRRHRRLPGESSDEGAGPLARGDHGTVSSMFVESAWTTVLVTGWHGGEQAKLIRREALQKHHEAFYSRFKNVHSD
jgi:hypothetical protein